MNNKAIVLFSGGQDSATCLAWALERFELVETIAFDYRQLHSVELEVRQSFFKQFRKAFPAWSEKLGEDHIIDAGLLGEISDTALTREMTIENSESGLPNTFVPGRNLVFLTIAAAIAYRRSAKHLIGGMCETDYSGYPDCRDDTIKALQVALTLGMGQRYVLHTPLMWIDKAATWKLAEDLGGQELVNLIIHETHTCYRGERSIRHAWGYGCGNCPACELRRNGWIAFDTTNEL